MNNLNSGSYPPHSVELGSEVEVCVGGGKPQWWQYFLCGLKGVHEEKMAKAALKVREL